MSNLAAFAKQVIFGFESEMNKLKSHPDRILIISITKIAEIHIQLAESLVNVIAAKLFDHNTHPSFKLPIFYLMDSIMKNVGGPYAALFSRYVVDIYTHTFDGVSPQDREKLEKLLVTWEERKLLTFDVLIKMRQFTNARKEFFLKSALVATMIQPTLSHNVISLPEPYDELRVPHMLYSDPHDLYHSSHIPHSSQPPYIDPQLDLHPVLFNPNVNPYPTLYNKPKRPRLFDMRPEDAALLGLIDQPPQIYNDPGPTGPSRDFVEPFIHQPVHGCHQPQLRDESRGRSHPRNDRGPLPGTGPAESRGSNSSRSRTQNTMTSSQKPGQEKGQSYPILVDHYSNQDSVGQPVGFPMTVAISQSGAESAMQDDLINILHGPISFLTDAFLCEMPVKVDTDHAIKTLTNIKNLFESCNSRNIFDDQTSVALSTVVLPRLASLIDTIHVPPPFPNISRGHTGHASKASMAQRLKPRTGRELIPKFRTEELSRKPTRFVRALYFDRPHQYADDGVRFRSLAELAKYTDISLSNKENLRKMESSGEKSRRPWFVQSLEWVNGSTNARNTAKTSDNTAISDQKIEVKTYIVPADEYFPRCPISNETFEQFWDPAKGEFMYRNAVKMLVTEEADSSFFRVAMPYNSANPLVRYAIVHKLLTFDSWLAMHRVVSLESLLQAVQSDHILRNRMAPLIDAVQGNDEQFIFVLQR